MFNKVNVLNSNMTPYHIYIEIDWDSVKDAFVDELSEKLNDYGLGDYTFSAYKLDLLYSEKSYENEKIKFLDFIEELIKQNIKFTINTHTKTLKSKQAVIDEIDSMELFQKSED